MFLKNGAAIDWKKVIYAFLSVTIFCILSYFFLDKITHILSVKLDNKFWEYVSWLGSWKSFIILTLSVCGANYLLKTLKRKTGKEILKNGIYLILSLLISGAIVQVLKFIAGRMRPVLLSGLGKYGFNSFSFGDIYSSFPSGHTTAAFAFFSMLALLFPRYKFWAYYFACMIGLSRLIVGAHFLSDVVAGAFIGILISNIIFLYLNKEFTKLKSKKAKVK